ncbi:MAG: dephospho-CoA kinase [Brevinematia bacterium]
MKRKDKFVVGIFGKIASGKSTVSRILCKKYKFSHINVDRLGHIALKKKKKSIIKNFGKGILTFGFIDRKKLGNIVFADRKKLYTLNSIVHQEIKKMAIEKISTSKKKYFILDAALLFEIGLDELCDFIIMVESPEDLIIKRALSSKNWKMEKIKNVLSSQEYLDVLKGKADFIIFNNSDVKKLEKQIDFLMNVIF